MSHGGCIVRAEQFGDIINGNDATSAIQRAIDAAYEAGGGVVQLPAGVCLVRGLTIRSRVTLEGLGESATIIRLADGANRNVIQTEDFDDNCKNGRLWFVEDGMPHGFGFRDFRIDGNRDHNEYGHGLALYGKRYTIDGVLIVNCAEDGCYSQGPDIGGQREIDDILETEIRSIRIHRCGRNGITYRGPHDGYIGTAFIGECDNIGLLTDTKSGSYNGAVDIGRVHSYACRVGVHIKTAGTALQRVIADANFMQGIIIDEHRVSVGQLWAFRNWRTDRGSERRSRGPAFLEDAIIELNQACQVGVATVRADFGGTGIRIRGSRT